eukprot:jgi/Mesvir1/29695/Mv00929-RA.1
MSRATRLAAVLRSSQQLLNSRESKRFITEEATPELAKNRRLPDDGLSLGSFIHGTKKDHSQAGALSNGAQPAQPSEYPTCQTGFDTEPSPRRRTVYMETYGCQMNVNDSQVVSSILQDHSGLTPATDPSSADVLLVNTCSIRENAEAKVWQRLGLFRRLKLARPKGDRPIVGVLGCMAERLKDKLLDADKGVDIVVGPDAYRDLPRLIEAVRSGVERRAVNVQLSLEETYADVAPVRPAGAVGAFVSIMRGCNNMCSFCVVPYTRGRERSRPVASILDEIRQLSANGVREVVLLGQNVNSYADASTPSAWTLRASRSTHSQPAAGPMDSGQVGVEQRGIGGMGTGHAGIELMGSGHEAAGHIDREAARQGPQLAAASEKEGPNAGNGAPALDPFARYYAKGFCSVYKPGRQRGDDSILFAELLDRVARVDPEMRVRFTSPHPKDFPDEVLDVIAAHPNVCKSLHLPVQSGSSAVLERMRRGYTREAYLDLVDHIRRKLPGVALSSDFISGFCGESEADHADTLSLLASVGYEQAFMFAYSRRDKTHAARHLEDDVPEEVKQRRLREVIHTFRLHATRKAAAEVGALHCVLVEGPSPRDPNKWSGRTCTNKWVAFDKQCVRAGYGPSAPMVMLAPGDYVAVQVTSGTAATLQGRGLVRTTLQEFFRQRDSLHQHPLMAAVCLPQEAQYAQAVGMSA